MTEAAVAQTWVGRPLERLEDEALLRGAGRFLDDLDPEPGAHHAAILRSPHAHARIVGIDPSRALNMPGVAGVLTGTDIVELSRPFPAAVSAKADPKSALKPPAPMPPCSNAACP